MSLHIIVVIVLTFIIHFINTLAYSVRIVGVRTGKIAVSFALFNIVALVSRTANTIQAPLLAKTIERSIKYGISTQLIDDFRWILFSATLASILAGFFIPTFQRVYSKAVNSFDIFRSVPKLLMHGFSKAGIRQFKNNIKIPSKENVKQMGVAKNIPFKIIIYNVIVVALLTVGVLSALYAGLLRPEFRTTASTLSSLITGLATILLFVFIDPYLSIMTDDVIAGKASEAQFRRCIMYMVIGRVFGTLLAQVLFLPSARLIAFVAAKIL